MGGFEKEMPARILHKWAKVERAGEESKAYTPELRGTIISLLELHAIGIACDGHVREQEIWASDVI